MSTGLLSGLLSAQPDAPAGSGMQVVMIDRKNIIINPDNRKIYRIGDVSRLKEDIKTNGINDMRSYCKITSFSRPAGNLTRKQSKALPDI